jgi:hypothetical protein
MRIPELTNRFEESLTKGLRIFYQVLSGLLALWGLVGAIRPGLLPINVSPLMMTTVALISIVGFGLGPTSRISDIRFKGIISIFCFGEETYLLTQTGPHLILASAAGAWCAFCFVATMATFIDLEKLRQWGARYTSNRRTSQQD